MDIGAYMRAMGAVLKRDAEAFSSVASDFDWKRNNLSLFVLLSVASGVFGALYMHLDFLATGNYKMGAFFGIPFTGASSLAWIFVLSFALFTVVLASAGFVAACVQHFLSRSTVEREAGAFSTLLVGTQLLIVIAMLGLLAGKFIPYVGWFVAAFLISYGVWVLSFILARSYSLGLPQTLKTLIIGPVILLCLLGLAFFLWMLVFPPYHEGGLPGRCLVSEEFLCVDSALDWRNATRLTVGFAVKNQIGAVSFHNASAYSMYGSGTCAVQSLAELPNGKTAKVECYLVPTENQTFPPPGEKLKVAFSVEYMTVADSVVHVAQGEIADVIG